jgi:hypothetical protein
MSRLREWATIEKFGTIADVLFKVAALVAALAAAGFFFLRPDVELNTRTQAFINLTALRASYAAENQSAPALVTEVANTYNNLNTRDLEKGGNVTKKQIPPSELCDRMPKLVEEVFPKSDCSQPIVTLGRGRYYERRLLDRNATEKRPLNAADLREALARLRSAEYLRARCFTKNVGGAKAANVRIRASEGFRRPGDEANDPFPLPPKDQFDVDFVTAPGEFEKDPKIQFGIDWDRASLTDSTVTLLVAGVLFLAFGLVLLNDFVRSPSGKGDR